MRSTTRLSWMAAPTDDWLMRSAESALLCRGQCSLQNIARTCTFCWMRTGSRSLMLLPSFIGVSSSAVQPSR
jgi:hypothetical protein